MPALVHAGRPTRPHLRRFARGLAGLGLLLASLISAGAEDKHSLLSIPGTNYWNSDSLWTLPGEPGAGDNVFVGVDPQAGIVLSAGLPLTYATNHISDTLLGSLNVDALPLGNHGTWTIAAVGLVANNPVPLPALAGIIQVDNTLWTNDEVYGDFQFGFFLQGGGIHKVEGDVTLGKHQGSMGSYFLAIPGEGSFTVGRDLIIGDSGAGEFLQLGGPLVVQRDMIVGRSSNGAGNTTLAGSVQVGGDLTVGAGVGSTGVLAITSTAQTAITGSLIVGDAGSGSAAILDGPFSAGQIRAGVNSGGDGHLIMTNSTASTNGVQIGRAGTGILTVSGGSLATTAFSLGQLDGGSGTVWLRNDATLTTGQQAIIGGQGTGTLELQDTGVGSTANLNGGLTLGAQNGGDGTLRIEAGHLTVTGSAVVGNAGSGHWIQSGGTASVTNTLQFGAGELHLSGGSLTAGTLVIGSGADLQVTGGDFSALTAQQSGGSLTFGSGLELTIAGTGARHVTDYTLAGGTLDVTTLRIAGGTFNQTGGTLLTDNFIYESGTLTGLVGSLVSFTLAPTATTFDAHFLSAGTFELDHLFDPVGGFTSTGTTTILAGGALTGGPVAIDDGTTTVQSGGSIDLPDPASVNGGNLNLESGSLFRAASFTQTGGVTDVKGGATFAAQGAFLQSGGAFTVRSAGNFSAQSVAVNGGSLTLAAGANTNFSTLPTLAISGTGTVALNTNTTFALPHATMVSGNGTTAGALTGTGSWVLANGETLALNRGTLAGTGGLLVQGGAEFDVIANHAELSRDVSNFGLTRLNAAVATGFFLSGNSTLTNQSTGILRVLDLPLTETDSNYNAIRASGLSVVNAGTMTIGALAAQPADNSAAFPWLYLDQSLANSGSLTLLQNAQLHIEGDFSNSGAVVLNNRSQLSAWGGGVHTGTFVLGNDPESFLWFKGAQTFHDTGTMFSGNGYVIVDGGTLHTTGGDYTPSINLELTGGLALPDATGLQPASGHWLRISGDISAVPIRVVSGAELQLTGGTNTNHITIESGGSAKLGSGAVLNAAVSPAGAGDIDNHGTISMGSVAGTGRLLNHADGVVLSTGGSTTGMETLLATINDGLLSLLVEDNDPNELHSNNYAGGIRFGDITNQGTAVFHATEVSYDLHDDINVRVGNYTQTAGTTTILTTAYDAALFPDGTFRADSFSNLGGSVTASGRIIVPTLLNQSLFTVGAGGLWLTGNFNNQGGTLDLTGRLVLDSGFSFANSGRLILNGTGSAVIQNGVSLYAGDFGVPTGATIEIRNRTLNGGGAITSNGTLIIGSGSTFNRNDGALTGPGEIRIASGGTATLSGTGEWSGTGQFTVEAGGLLTFGPRDSFFNLHRIYGRTLVNAGTVVHDSTNNIGTDGGTLIQNSGLWVEQGAGQFIRRNFVGSFESSGTGVFQNLADGEYRKEGAGTFTFATAKLENTGTLNILEGGLRLDAGSDFAGNSTVTLADGTSLILGSGTHTLGAGLHFTGGTVTLGGTTIMNGDYYATNALIDSALMGDHTLHGTWAVNPEAELNSAATTRIAADATLTILPRTNYGTIFRLYDHTLVNSGTVVHQGFKINVNGGTVIENGGLWQEQTGGLFSQRNAAGGLEATGTGVFRNLAGAEYRKEGAGTFTFAAAKLENTGLVNIQGGGLVLDAGSDFAGSSNVTMAGGTQLTLAGGTHTLQDGAHFTGGTLSVGGEAILHGNIFATNALIETALLGDHTLHGNWAVDHEADMASAATTRIAADGTLTILSRTNYGAIFRLYDHTLVNNGTVVHQGYKINVNGGTVIENGGLWREQTSGYFGQNGPAGGFESTGAGVFRNLAGGTFRKEDGSETNFVAASFDNRGTVDVQAGVVRFSAGLAQQVGSTLTGGTWIVHTGAAVREDGAFYTTNQANVTLYGSGFIEGLGGLNRNEGTLRLLGGNVFTTGTAFTNTGLLDIGVGSAFTTSSTLTNSGTLHLDGTLAAASLLNSGTFTGSAGFMGSLVNAGTLAPGNSPGLLTVTGDLTLQGTSVLLMELGGLGRGTGYDAIDVSGAFNAGGTLNVTFYGGFNATGGNSFDLFNDATVTGTFGTLNLPTLAQGLTWDTSALYSSGVLSVTAAAIPEPSAYAGLAGLAALGLAAWRRRRQAQTVSSSL